MKIAILVPNFSEYSGDARVAQLQAEEFAEKGNDVTIFALSANIKPKNYKLFIMGMPKSLFWQRVYRLIFPLDLIKASIWLPKLKNFDLIISHLYPMNWLAFLAKKFYKIKYTYWYHGTPNPELFPNLYERIYMHIYIFLTKVTVQNVDHAVSVSNAARRQFKKYTGIDSEVIYNHLDLERFQEGIDGSEIRRLHNIGNDPVILFVGRISPHKGVHLLIDVFKLIKQQIPNLKLIIAGKHAYEDYSEKLKKASDESIIFVDHISYDDIPYYYAACDIYTTCSLCETFDLPIVEAQLCGKPAVAFDIGAHSEIINKNSILIEKGNIYKFAEACTNILKNKN